MNAGRRAVFFDRDGVLVDDVDLLVKASQIRVKLGVPEALTRLRAARFLRVIVSNQTVVSRGLLSEEEMCALEAEIESRLTRLGAPGFDGFYYCPHHPNATLEQYRAACACRKPREGMLMQAREDLAIDLGQSFMIGDRMSDVLAGQRAGCRSILVRTGAHEAKPIKSDLCMEGVRPDAAFDKLAEAVDWILREAHS